MKNAINISSLSSGIQGKSRIWNALRGLYLTNMLKAAVKLDLFNLLEKKPLTGEEIKTHLKLNGRGLYDFLDTLVGMELLDRHGRGKDAYYSNTSEVSLFLVKDSPQYFGGWFAHKMPELEHIWGSLVEALKTGNPQKHEMKDSGKGLFDVTYDSDETRRAFVEGMNFGQLVSFKDFAQKFDFSPYHTLCDIGGSNALLSILAAEQNEHLKCITFDLPELESLAREKIERSGLSDRITVVNGNFFKNDFPKADIITMGNILHDWNLEQKKFLVKKAYEALTEGGAFVVIECIIDNERSKNTAGLLMSLHMLLVTEGGFDYTAADFDSWAREAGFKKTTPLALSGDSSAVIAYK